jgi:hypothetical protein
MERATPHFDRLIDEWAGDGAEVRAIGFDTTALGEWDSSLPTLLTAIDPELATVSVRTGAARSLGLDAGGHSRLLPPDHLLFTQTTGVASAVGFDVDPREVRGRPVPVLDNVDVRHRREVDHDGRHIPGTRDDRAHPPIRTRRGSAIRAAGGNHEGDDERGQFRHEPVRTPCRFDHPSSVAFVGYEHDASRPDCLTVPTSMSTQAASKPGSTKRAPAPARFSICGSESRHQPIESPRP